MLRKEIWEIAQAIILSIGGGGLIIFLLSSYMGKIWATRILEKEKRDHKMEIEKYKKELEVAKKDYERYSNKKFEVYKNAWEVICDIESLIYHYLHSFIDQEYTDSQASQWLEVKLKEIRKINLGLEKSYIFIDNEHCKNFEQLIQDSFSCIIGINDLLTGKKLDSKELDKLFNSFGASCQKVKQDLKEFIQCYLYN